MNPLTQFEIDATRLLDGWTVDEDGYLCDADGHLLSRERNKAIARLVRACLANRLEAAPPVEQSEQKSGVWVDSGHGLEFREIVVGGFQCPVCRIHDETKCKWTPFAWPKRADKHLWLAPAAPPAVIEPEPELDEFEQWATELIEDTDFHARYLSGVNDALKMYRVTRKGDK